MLHRVKKKNDLNEGKWVGVGGGFEPGETADECLAREVSEETGLRLKSTKFYGVIDFVSDKWENEEMYLYTAEPYDGEVTECNEGDLKWVPKDEALRLPMWEGDKVFFRYISDEKPFKRMCLRYEGDTLVDSEFIRY